MIRLACLAALALLAAPVRAFEVNGYELVYSYPVETALAEPDVRKAQDVWPEMFDKAKRTIDVEEFYITPSTGDAVLQPSLDALMRAAKRGVKIRFLLEKKFEKNSADGIAFLKTVPGLELRTIEWSKLQGSGIVHAKYFVVDSTEGYVGSQNFDWRSLKHIHELGLRVTDRDVASGIQRIFNADWDIAGKQAAGEGAPALAPKHPDADYTRRSYLVASPWLFDPPGVADSEAELVRLIGSAKEEVAVQLLDYNPTSFGNPKHWYGPVDGALRDAAVRGVKVKLLVSNWNTEEPALTHLRSLSLLPNVEIKVITIPLAKQGYIPFARVCHSKYMVVDGKTAWIGTSNWSGGYLNESRNLEIVITDPELAPRVRKIHQHLWTSAYAAPLEVQKAYIKVKR